MPDPISFTSASPRYDLPFIFSGQTQKEFIVNEAYVRLDALLHPAIEGEAAAPPASPVTGDCWLVGSGGAGDWAGRDGEIACRQVSGWAFVKPRDGMRIFDKSSGSAKLYLDGWRTGSLPAAPAGGSTVDSEARGAIAALIASLQQVGILPLA